MAIKKSRPGWLLRTIRKTGWAPAATFVFYVVAANVFNGYVLYPLLDIPTHLVAGIALAYFLADAFDNMQDVVGHIPQPIRLLLTFSCVSTAAVFWEFYEFLCDQFLGTTMQFGRDDTVSDLFFGLFGGALFLALHKVLRLSERADKPSSSAEKKVG